MISHVQWLYYEIQKNEVYIQMIRDGYIKTINDMNRDYEEDTVGAFA